MTIAYRSQALLVPAFLAGTMFTAVTMLACIRYGTGETSTDNLFIRCLLRA